MERPAPLDMGSDGLRDIGSSVTLYIFILGEKLKNCLNNNGFNPAHYLQLLKSVQFLILLEQE